MTEHEDEVSLWRDNYDLAIAREAILRDALAKIQKGAMMCGAVGALSWADVEEAAKAALAGKS